MTTPRFAVGVLVFAGASIGLGCSDDGTPPPPMDGMVDSSPRDGAMDADTDASMPDTGSDAATDAATDARMDATSDGGGDSAMTPEDAAMDADAPDDADASGDATVADAATDTGAMDAAPDATDSSVMDTGSGVFTPVCRFDLDGTGTIHEVSAYFTHSGPFLGVACDSADASFRIGLRLATSPVGTYSCGAATMGSMAYTTSGTTWGANIGGASSTAPCTIIIDELTGGRARGRFSGTLERETGTGTPTTRLVTSGRFDVLM